MEYTQDVPRRSQDVPRRPQDPPKTPQDAPRQFQDGPKTRPRRPQDAPRHLQERIIRGPIWDGKVISSGISSRPRFLRVLGSILGGFGIDFYSFYEKFAERWELLRSKIVSRTFQVRASKKSGASRSMSNQVYLGVVFCLLYTSPSPRD